MASRVELQAKLEELLGSKSVYYQAPPTNGMTYPAILYNKSRIDFNIADNIKYIKKVRYELIVISKRPDHPVIEQILELPYTSYDRTYKADNLYHDVLTLYY